MLENKSEKNYVQCFCATFSDLQGTFKSLLFAWSKYLNPLYSGKPLTSAFANREDPDEMQHYKLNAARCCISSGSTLFVKVKEIFRQNNTIFLKAIT